MNSNQKIKVYIGEEDVDGYYSTILDYDIQDFLYYKNIDCIHVSAKHSHFVKYIFSRFKSDPKEVVPVTVDKEIQHLLDAEEVLFKDFTDLISFLDSTFKMEDSRSICYSSKSSGFRLGSLRVYLENHKVRFYLNHIRISLDKAMSLFKDDERKACVFNLDLIKRHM